MDLVGTLPQPFGRTEALDLGISPRRLERAVDRGHLTRIAPSLYAVSAPWRELAPWVRHERLVRAAVRLTPDAVVSHLSAAVLLGLPHPAYEPAKVTMTLLDDTRTSRRDEWRQFHRGETPPEHVFVRAGRAHLTAARTVIDCARELHPRDALAVMDGALRGGHTVLSQLEDMRRHQRRWPGVTGADVVLRLANPLRENWLESVSAWAFHRQGLPVGVPQAVVLDRQGRFVARVDTLWPGLGIVGEADGEGKYELAAPAGRDAGVITTMRRSVHAQRGREDRLRDLGLEICRWGPREAVAMDPLAERFRAAAARADPGRVSARFRCSCCRRELTDCARATLRPLLGA